MMENGVILFKNIGNVFGLIICKISVFRSFSDAFYDNVNNFRRYVELKLSFSKQK